MTRAFLALVVGACLGFAGCASHKANQYAYAPPLAPPVYPQPQTSTQPVAFPAPATLPPGAVVAPGAVLPPGAALPPGAMIAPGAAAPSMMPPAASAGVVPAMSDGSCPACPAGCDGQHGAVPVTYEAAIQTPPCPQGP